MTDTHLETTGYIHHQTIIEGTRPNKWLNGLFVAFVAFGCVAFALGVLSGSSALFGAPEVVINTTANGAMIMLLLALLTIFLVLALGPFMREPFREVIEHKEPID